MNSSVYLLVFLLLNFEYSLAGKPPQVDYAENSPKLEPETECKIQDHCLETCYQNLRQLICSCDGFSFEESGNGDKLTTKAKENGIKSHILWFLDVLKDLNDILETFIKGIVIFVFVLYNLLHHLISEFFYILTWIYWFLQIICFTVFKIFYNVIWLLSAVF